MFSTFINVFGIVFTLLFVTNLIQYIVSPIPKLRPQPERLDAIAKLLKEGKSISIENVDPAYANWWRKESPYMVRFLCKKEYEAFLTKDVSKE